MARVDSGGFRFGNSEYRYLVVGQVPRTLPGLTPAEGEIAQLVSDGLTSQDVAQRRGTSVHTVGNQLASIFKKLGVSSRLELVERLTRGTPEATPKQTP